jgi:hypothetical protein
MEYSTAIDEQSFERMVRFYNAYGQQPVESCEGAITARPAPEPRQTRGGAG